MPVCAPSDLLVSCYANLAACHLNLGRAAAKKVVTRNFHYGNAVGACRRALEINEAHEKVLTATALTAPRQLPSLAPVLSARRIFHRLTSLQRKAHLRTPVAPLQALYRLGMALHHTGETAEAASTLERVLS